MPLRPLANTTYAQVISKLHHQSPSPTPPSRAMTSFGARAHGQEAMTIPELPVQPRGMAPKARPFSKAATHSLSHPLTQENIMMGDKGSRFKRTSNTTLVPKLQTGRQEEIYGGSARREQKTRGCYDWKQKLTISRDPRHHHPVPKVQEGRQEEIMMGDKKCRSHETPAPLSGSQVTRSEEESMMGGKRSRFPKTPGTTIRLPSCKKGDKSRL